MSHPYEPLIDGVAKGARFERRGFNGEQLDSATMALEVVGGLDSWLLSIHADTGRGISLLGRIRTLPWRSGLRTVAICAHPGAIAWEVYGRRIRPKDIWQADPLVAGDPAVLSGQRIIGVNMTQTHQIGGEWGIKPIRGFAERAVTSAYKTGASGAFTLRGNVLGWTAFNDNAAPGSVVINTNPSVIVPANGGTVQGGQIIYLGYANFFSFIGTTSYRVDYEIENPFEGAGET
jgi:hypothetical protein